MAKLNDLTNLRFGRLTVIERAPNKKASTMWLCQCDCGKEHTIRGTSLSAGVIRSCGCLFSDMKKSQRGPNGANWKGGKRTQNGYVLILTPMEIRTDGKSRYKQEHVLVMEQHIGRNLASKETVHHINGIRSDNRIENLELWSSNHPKGQRIEDKISWAIETLKLYRPDYLSEIASSDL